MNEKPFVPVSFAVLTVSDTRNLAEDKSGAMLAERIEAAGHKLAARAIVKDEIRAIRAKVRGWIKDKKIDAVITSAGIVVCHIGACLGLAGRVPRCLGRHSRPPVRPASQTLQLRRDHAAAR